jgi:23S rRNA (cytosine1962-C5)-methyltransferase
LPVWRLADPDYPVVRLSPGRDKSLRQRHPWIFSGALAAADAGLGSGETVAVESSDGRFLAYAAWSPASQIRARVWTFDGRARIDGEFFARCIARAVAARATMLDARHTGCRLVHGESDGLPGVIADRYDDTIVLQLASAGAERWRAEIVAALVAATGAHCVYERSDVEVRKLEGLEPRVGVACGALREPVTFVEDGLVYRVDVSNGQKTGFYLDQRTNRALVRELAAGKDVLNTFAYTGGFTLAALAGGAQSVLSIDSSADALELARENVSRNPSLPSARASFREADAFAELRKLRDRGAAFDLVVLDPPKFAPTAAHAERASRAYKDVNLLALKLLRPGGLLATFSCSGGIDAALFRKIVAGAAQDAGADASIVGVLGAAADHPVALAFPEGEYLKGLLVRKA